ncbi:MAG: AMIN domain-containing protein [Tissierellia bacterium]|nr:AMIN domain-containing protein [Tissierellia bacterium]
MKMKRVILVMFVMLFIFSHIGHASNTSIQVSMGGTKVSVRQVPIIMDGKEVITEFPSFVYVDRTLVPIRFVSENYGAKVGWDDETKTAIVTYGDKEARFTIDSNVAIINGEKKLLDKYAIPRLASLGDESARTMVPLRFVTEIFGYEVGWDSEKNLPFINSSQDQDDISLINDISIHTGSAKNRIVVNSTGELEYTTMYLENSKKLVIDIEDAELSLATTKDRPGSIDLDDEVIERVQYSQFSYEPNITRIVVTLKDYENYNITSSNDGTGLIVSFGGNKIGAISQEIINGKQVIVVDGAGHAKMNFMSLKNPERFVIDLLDSTLVGDTYYNYDYELGFIQRIRVSQFLVDDNYDPTDQIVRIVLDIKEGISDPSVKIDTDGDRIIIYPEESLWDNISYINDDDVKIFTINNIVDTEYEVDLDDTSKKLVVTIPSENTNLNEGTIYIRDGFIDKVDIEKDDEETKLSIKFMRLIEYTVLSDTVDNEIILSLERKVNLDKNHKTIVIDPGHGGDKPGAISVRKRFEKDLNLSVSLKLRDKLENLGYNVIMTRDTDVDIDLYERARIANDSDADLFVSIHGNSHINSVHKGIQVLYCPAFNSSVKEGDQHPFAKAIMDALLAGTGAIDKGIIQRPNLVVLRETKMPAVLVETGFISNPEEEELLYTEEYQDIIVDSIVKGIENYLEMN